MKALKTYILFFIILITTALTCCANKKHVPPLSSSTHTPTAMKEEIPDHIDAAVHEQIKRLQSDLLSERYQGSFELGKMGAKAKDAIPYLIEVLPSSFYRDPWASVKRPGLMAVDALDKIDPNWRDSDAAKEAVKKAIDIISNNKKTKTRRGALFTLTEIANDDAIAALIKEKNYAFLTIANKLAKNNITDSVHAPKIVEDIINKRAFQGSITNALDIIKPDWRNSEAVKNFGPELIAEMQKAEKCSPRNIISQLGETGDKRAVQPLINIMDAEVVKDHDCSMLKGAASTALGKLKDPRAVESLINALFYGSAYLTRPIENLNPKWSKYSRFKGQRFLHENAAWALGEIGDKRAVEPLILALKHLNATGQGKAAEALGKLGDRRAVLPLAQSICDGSNRIGDFTIKALDKIDADWRKSSEAKKVATRAINILRVPYDFHDRKDRGGAVLALYEIGDPRGADVLISALKDPHDYRTTAASGLEKIDPDWNKRKAANRLFADAAKIFLSDGITWDDREAAVFAMHLVDEKRALEAIFDAVKQDADKASVGETARALSKTEDKRAIEPLIIMLSYSNDWSRTGEHPFLEALERLDPDWRSGNAAMRAIPEIIKTLKDNKGDYNDIEGAAITLGEIGDDSAVAALIEVLEDSEVREHDKDSVAFALGKIGDKRAVEPIISILKDKIGDMGIDEDEFHSLLISAVSALGEIGDKRAVEHIIPFLKHRRSEVRDAVAAALGSIGDARAAEPLIDTLNDTNKYGVLLQVTGTSYYGLFPTESLRIEIINALGNIGGDAAIKVIKDRAKNDPYYEVRKASKTALGKITNK